MSRCTIRLCPEFPGPVINPNIYGHSVEHAGRCVYEGIWVGPRSKIPNERGLRLDVLAALKQLRAPVLKWPGGCFAGTYHWRDGVGPQNERPQTANIWWRQAEPNAFGTDEFLQLCELAGSAPFICLNMGTGSVRESLEWLEYCNHGGDTAITRLRGRGPAGVKRWSMGQEPWGCGGHQSAEDYAREYARHATFFRKADPETELYACGCGVGERPEWNHDFCQAMPHTGLIDGLTIHRFFSRGAGAEFNDDDYHALFGDLIALERDIEQAEHILAYFYPDKPVGVAVDEWGVRHPEANVDNGLEQANTLRDAVFAGAALNLFNRHAGRVAMANLAQAINVLHSIGITEGGRMVLTPTYYVYDMMRYHMGARSVMADMDCDTYAAVPTGMDREHGVSHLSASASIAGSKVLLTVANQTIGRDVEATIQVSGGKIGSVIGRLLTSADARDANSFEKPKTVFPKRIKPEPADGELVCVFPAHSFTSLNLSLA